MDRRASTPRWPAAPPGMARLVREHDWGATPLGEAAGWPQSLRTAVDIMLHSPGPVSVLWGPEHVQLYNDAYIAIADDRHPAGLGRPAAENWSEIYESFLEPIFRRVSAGEAVTLEDQMVQIRGRGAEGLAERYFTASFSPIRDETGAVAGVFHPVTETTELVLTGRRLQRSKARLRGVLEGMGEAFGLLDHGFRILAFNTAALRLETRPLEEIVGRRHWDVYPGSEESEIGRLLKRALAEQRSVSLEHRCIREDGSPRWLEVRAHPVPEGLAVFWGDITERKEAEARLRASEERQSFLLRLSDALRPLSDPIEVQAEAARLLGEHLGSDRACYIEIEGAHGECVVARAEAASWRRPGAGSPAGRHPLGDWPMPWLADGRTWVVRDVATDPAMPDEQREAWRGNGIGALVVVPLLKEGRPVGAWLAGQEAPRDWTAGEILLVEEVAERTWEAVERARAEAALRESEARFRQFGDASGDLLWIRSAETLDFEYVSPAFEEIHGIRIDAFLKGSHVRRWAGAILPEDREAVLSNLRRLREGEHVLQTFRILRSDGAVRWIRDTSFPLLDGDGRVQRIGGIAHDATEEVELEDRLRLLVAELQHRSRNLIAVVQGVSERTLATSVTLEEFRPRFRARLGALGRVNGLLSRLEEGGRIGFDQILRAELQAHGVLGLDGEGEQVALRGPKGIRLRSATVQTFALAIHELATNALKHGALAGPEGRLEVKWGLVPGRDGGQRLRVDWRETGGPPPPAEGAPPRRQGYGRELIERALPYQLRAQTSYELGPEGVRCTLLVPVSSTLDPAVPEHDGGDDG